MTSNPPLTSRRYANVDQLHPRVRNAMAKLTEDHPIKHAFALHNFLGDYSPLQREGGRP